MDGEETSPAADASPEQPAIGQGEICADCHFRLPGQLCDRSRDLPDLQRYTDGTEWCQLYEGV